MTSRWDLIHWALLYAWATTRHKWLVLMAGRKLGCSYWRLVVHDLSKYGPHEVFAYGRQFFGDKGDPLGFAYAWLHHQRTNKHHWEAWIPVTGHSRSGYEDGDPLPMPDRYIREMAADWLGASKAYEGQWPTKEWPWFTQHFWRRVRVNPGTRNDLLLLFHCAFPEAEWWVRTPTDQLP